MARSASRSDLALGAYAEQRARTVPGTTWWARTAGAEVLVLPDGCIDVLWVDGELVVAGPDRRARRHASPPGTEVSGVRLDPGVAPSLLRTPADELVDQVVPLADVLGRRAAGQLAADADRAAPGRARATAIERSLAALGPVEAAAPARRAARLLDAGQPVATVAAALGWSERSLQRAAGRWYGYRPKHLARVLRLRRALDLARSDAPLASVAALAGYADQAHLARDARDLTGTTVGALVGR